MSISHRSITKVKYKKGRNPVYEIFIDGEFACVVAEELVVQERIVPGRHVFEEELEQWIYLGEKYEAMDRALRWLGRRPYTRKEIKQRLTQQDYEVDIAEQVTSELMEKGYINELEYAIMQTERRMKRQGRGRRWVTAELLAKGVPRDMIDQALQMIAPEEEYEHAKVVGRKRWNQLEKLDANERKHKVGQSLMRRGIPTNLIRKIIEELEQESGSLD